MQLVRSFKCDGRWGLPFCTPRSACMAAFFAIQRSTLYKSCDPECYVVLALKCQNAQSIGPACYNQPPRLDARRRPLRPSFLSVFLESSKPTPTHSDPLLKPSSPCHASIFVQEPKPDSQSQKIALTAPKNFLSNSMGVTGHCPVEQGF